MMVYILKIYPISIQWYPIYRGILVVFAIMRDAAKDFVICKSLIILQRFFSFILYEYTIAYIHKPNHYF